jgi:hypothetical protein
MRKEGNFLRQSERENIDERPGSRKNIEAVRHFGKRNKNKVFRSSQLQQFLIGSWSIQGWDFQSNGPFEFVGIELVSQRNM